MGTSARFEPYRQSPSLYGSQGPSSAIAEREWQDFLARHNELYQMLLGEIQTAQGQRQQPMQDWSQPSGAGRSWGGPEDMAARQMVQPVRPSGLEELLGQARFWGIEGAERMSPAELHDAITERRAGIERGAETDVGSITSAILGLASEAGGSFSKIMGDLLGPLPFANETLRKISGSETAKRWLYNLMGRTSEFTEAMRAAQPSHDKTAFEVMAATGKVAGYALPAVAAWQVVGAAGGAVPSAWAAQVPTPFMRAAIQGGLSGAILEAGNEVPAEHKAFNIALGAALGGASVLPRWGASLGLGTIGAGIGGQVGETPGERTRHAIEGAIAGAVVGLAPAIIAGHAKVRKDFKGPTDQMLDEGMALRSGRYSTPASARIVEPQQLQSGPDFTVEPQYPVRVPTPGEQRALTGRAESTLDPLAPEPLGPMDIPTNLRRAQPENVIDLNPTVPPGYEGRVGGVPEMEIPLGQQRLAAGERISEADMLRDAIRTGTPMRISNVELPTNDALAYDQAIVELENHLGRVGLSADEIDGIIFDVGNRRFMGSTGGGFGLMEIDPRTGSELITQAMRQERENWGQIQSLMGEGAAKIAQMTGVPYEQAMKQVKPLLIQEVKLGTPSQEIAQRLRWEMDDLAAMEQEQLQAVTDALKPLDISKAAASADAITKQNIIMEGGTLPEAMGKVQLTDIDVARAAKNGNPGGVTVIRSIANPLGMLRNLPEPTAEMFAEGLPAGFDVARIGPEQITFVQRGNKWDALIGPVDQIQVDQYAKFGVFEGQEVVTGSGIVGQIKSVNPATGKLRLERRYGGPPVTVRAEKVTPSRFGFQAREAPVLWDSFKADMLGYMAQETTKAGMAPVMDLADFRVTSMFQTRLGDYMDRLGINDAATRQLIEMDMNARWVEELRTIDPESNELQTGLAIESSMAEAEAEASDLHNIVESLEEKAEKRGFIWVSDPGQGGTLKDIVNPAAPDIPVDTDDAAREFLARMDRTLPDLNPAAEVPAEVAMMVPTDAQRVPHLGTEFKADHLVNSIDDLEREVFALGSGGAGLPPGGGGGGSLPPGPDFGRFLPPGDKNPLGAQFDRVRRADPQKMYELNHRFQGLLSSGVRYTRYATLKLEQMLTEAGVDLGRAWQHYEEYSTAQTRAFNEGHPWISEWGDIMREFPGRTLRDGTVTRIHEIENYNQRMAAFWRLRDSHGLSEAKVKQMIQADDRITSFMHRFAQFLAGDDAFVFDMDREIFRYMPHVRARQAQDAKNPYDVSFLPDQLQFFGEFAREGNLQFRIMDARELGNYMVRSAMAYKYENAAWHQLVNAWQDPRIPEAMREYMLDYANLSRYGYDPSGELAIRGIQGVMNKVFQTPVTAREAQHLLNAPSSAMYMSMLAGRMSIFFRDAMQPLLALAKVEAPFMGGVYKDVLTGAKASPTNAEISHLREIYQRGLDGGWIQKENPNLESAGMFEEATGEGTELPQVPTVPAGSPILQDILAGSAEGQAARRELAARIGDAAHGLPAWLVRPSQSNVSTLKWYGRQGQLHRLIVGEAAYRQAHTYLRVYRQSHISAIGSRNPAEAQPYDMTGSWFDNSLEGRSFFGSFEPPIRRRLKELVEQGDDEGAARLFAREVSHWSQFKYGRKEMPQVLRRNVGRLASMLGNFTGQFIEAFNSSLSNGSMRHRVRYLSIIGGMSALMYYLKNKTGWSFNRWAWLPHAFEYAGGPLLQAGATAVAGLSGIMARANDRRPSPLEQGALEQIAGDAPGMGMADYFPYTGYVRSAAEYMSAYEGINPLEQAARYTVTGDRGSRIDVERMIEDYARRREPGGHIPQGSLSPNGGLMPGQGAPAFPQGFRYPTQPPRPTGAQQ